MRYNSIKKFVSFLGPVRTGHNLIASLLCAHPNIAISIEVNPLLRLAKKKSRHKLFSIILKYCEYEEEREKGGYSYFIKESEQRNIKKIKVIGDSMTGSKNMKLFSEKNTLKTFCNYIKLPIYWLVVLRNPFDIIESSDLMNEKGIDENINIFFKTINITKEIYENDKYKTLIVYIEDFIGDVEIGLSQILDFINMPYTSDYLNICSDFVFSKPHKVFREKDWTESQIEKVDDFIKNNSELERYIR